MSASAIAFTLLCASMWAVLCRIKQMHPGVTRRVVFAQHAALGMGLAGGAVFSAEWARAALAAGVFVFLLLSASRWRDRAPPGTNVDKETST